MDRRFERPLWELLFTLCWACSAVADIIRYSPNPLDTLVDVGANVGQTVMEFCDAAPKLRVYAYEPISRTYDDLVRNTANLRNVACFKKALGASTGYGRIYLKADCQQNSLNPILNTRTSSSERVEIDTLDSICRKQNIDHIDVLKTDTENYDLDVMAGGLRMLSEGRVSFVLCEVGFSPHDELHTNFCELVNLLYGHDFEFLSVYDRLYHHVKPRVRSWCNALFCQRILLS